MDVKMKNLEIKKRSVGALKLNGGIQLVRMCLNYLRRLK